MTTTMEMLVIEALASLLDMDDASRITPQTRIEDDLGIDSGLLLELFMMMEERVPNLQIDPAELRPTEFETVGKFAAMIDSSLKAAVPA